MVGLGERLGLTRTAHFRANVIIYELMQVPMASGSFSVKWKFGDGTDLTEESPDRHHQRQSHSHSALASLRPTSDNKSNSRADRARSSSRGANGKADSDPESSTSPSRTTTRDSTTTGTDTGASSTLSSVKSNVSDALSPMTSRQESSISPVVQSSSKLRDHSNDSNRRQHSTSRYERKGRTQYIPLDKAEHKVRFLRHICCNVAIPLKSAHGTKRPVLQASPLRLTIRREARSKTGKIEEFKWGEVSLDLSQFVRSSNNRKIKRYLLNESKTNETISVEVKMEWLGGASDFDPPPFSTGRINHEKTVKVHSVLSNSDFNKSGSSLASGRSSNRHNSNNGSEMSRAPSTSSLASMQSSSNNSSSLPSSRKDESGRKGWKPPAFYTALLKSDGDYGMAGQEAIDVIERIFEKSDLMLSPSHSLAASPITPGSPFFMRNFTPHASQSRDQSAFSSRVPSDATARPRNAFLSMSAIQHNGHADSQDSVPPFAVPATNGAKKEGLRILTHGRPTHAATLPADAFASSRHVSSDLSTSAQTPVHQPSSDDSRVHFQEQRASVSSAPSRLSSASSRKCPFGESCSEHFHLHAPHFDGDHQPGNHEQQQHQPSSSSPRNALGGPIAEEPESIDNEKT